MTQGRPPRWQPTYEHLLPRLDTPLTQDNQIAEILAAEETEGTPLIPFLINPHSFSQSVENVFYFSFLVRDGKVAIEVETSEDSPYYGDAITCLSPFPSSSSSSSSSSTDALPSFLVRSEPATEEDRMGGGAKHQLIFELTIEIWEVRISAPDSSLLCLT
jgi:hypothetical protein